LCRSAKIPGAGIEAGEQIVEIVQNLDTHSTRKGAGVPPTLGIQNCYPELLALP